MRQIMKPKTVSEILADEGDFNGGRPNRGDEKWCNDAERVIERMALEISDLQRAVVALALHREWQP